MKGGADGLLWIREYPDPLQDQVVWVGFSEAWERKKRIAMPASLHVRDISEDRVLVLARGAHDERSDRGSTRSSADLAGDRSGADRDRTDDLLLAKPLIDPGLFRCLSDVRRVASLR